LEACSKSESKSINVAKLYGLILTSRKMSTCAKLHKAVSTAAKAVRKATKAVSTVLGSKSCVHCSKGCIAFADKQLPNLRHDHCCIGVVTEVWHLPSCTACKRQTGAATATQSCSKLAKAFILTPTDSSSGLKPGDPSPRLSAQQTGQHSTAWCKPLPQESNRASSRRWLLSSSPKPASNLQVSL